MDRRYSLCRIARADFRHTEAVSCDLNVVREQRTSEVWGKSFESEETVSAKAPRQKYRLADWRNTEEGCAAASGVSLVGDRRE